MHEMYLLFLPKGINLELKPLKIILPGTIFIAMWALRQRIGYAGDPRWSEYTCDVKDTDMQPQGTTKMLLRRI